MRRTVLLTILILTIPALCGANAKLKEPTELPGFVLDSFHLESGNHWTTDGPGFSVRDLPGSTIAVREDRPFLMEREFSSPARQDLPDDMVSMMSFVWAELTGCADVVREVRTFSRQWRNRRRSGRSVSRQVRDERSRWKFVVAWRVTEKLNLAARIRARGGRFTDGRLAWQLSAADILPQKLGVTTVYRNGSFRIEPDELVLNHRAEAKVVVNF